MSVENVVINHERIAEVIQTSLEAGRNHRLLFREGYAPERDFIQLISKYSKAYGNEMFEHNALFLNTSMVYGDSTARLFRRISDTSKFEKFAWVFEPEKALQDEEKTISALLSFYQPGNNKNAIYEWGHNCEILVARYGGDIRNFFRENENDALKIIDSLVVYPHKKGKEGLRRFGPKLSRLYLQWVTQYGLYRLKNAEKIGVPVDFQVARLLIQTKGLVLEKPSRKHLVSEVILTPFLAQMCIDNGWNPREVSEVLWTIGERGCNKAQHDNCPLEAICTSLISRKRYDKEGIFDPKDVGRYNIG